MKNKKKNSKFRKNEGIRDVSKLKPVFTGQRKEQAGIPVEFYLKKINFWEK